MGKQRLNSGNQRYRIQIQGVLDEQWLSWFNGNILSLKREADGKETTILAVVVPDQAKLRGILNQIWDLNLVILSLTPIDSD